MLIMASLKHWLFTIAIIFYLIEAMRSSPAEATTDPEELEPLLVRTVRQVAFRGQSFRLSLPGTNNGWCDCQYFVVCASQLDKITSSCQLPSGVRGVCCPPEMGGSSGLGTVAGKRSSVLPQQRPPMATTKKEYWNIINQSSRKGLKNVQEFDEIEKRLLRKDIVLEHGTPASNHLKVYKVGPQTAVIHKNALTVAMASLNMRSEFQLPYHTSTSKIPSLQVLDVKNSILNKMCPEQPSCPNPNSKYRTADGSCNNLNNPQWGMSQTGLTRLLPSKYEDGILAPRVTSVTGRPLPLARRLSTHLWLDNNLPDLRFTLSVMQWAQFIDHELTHSPFPEIVKEVPPVKEGIQCCTKDNKLFPPGTELHPMCMPIEIPNDDEFFSQRGHTCMNFVRSSLAIDHGCRFGFQENVNILTQWIDGSTVYGQNQYDQNKVRSHRNGLMRTSSNNFLPKDPEAAECDAPNRGGICYLAGESRVNEQPGLTMMHTIWMRQHNRIARELQHLNPGWSDETVFQETRRIIVAQITHITYNEWLPIIVGEPFMTKFGLSPRRSGFSSDYDPRINANINNEFATAAFRFGHSLVQGIMNLFSANGRVSSNRLRDNFLTGHLITQPGAFDGFLRGLTRQPSQKLDTFVTQDLTNHLYQTPLRKEDEDSKGSSEEETSEDSDETDSDEEEETKIKQVPKFNFGMDLMALNIQRGRDHAIGTYNEARELCGLRKARSFIDLTDTIPLHTIQRMQQLYESVDDIDLFEGGMSETAVFGGLLGPTFLCIVGDQFARLKKADRHFYELQGQAGSFSLVQLQEIKRTSWARIVCDNSENLDSVQPLAFRMPNSNYFNGLVPCSSPIIPQIDLQPW